MRSCGLPSRKKLPFTWVLKERIPKLSSFMSPHRENFLATIVVEQDPRASQENDIRKNSKNFQSITQKPRGCPCATRGKDPQNLSQANGNCIEPRISYFSVFSSNQWKWGVEAGFQSKKKFTKEVISWCNCGQNPAYCIICSGVTQLFHLLMLIA